MDLYDRLCSAIAERNWNCIINILKPKYFPRNEKGDLMDKKILAKVVETLIAQDKSVPFDVKVVLLKCIVNSCVDGYANETYVQDSLDSEWRHNYCYELYKSLSENHTIVTDRSESFLYDGVAEYAADCLVKYAESCQDGDLEIVRLNTQFLCNLLTFACKSGNIPQRLISNDLKRTIMTLAESEHVPVAKAACAYMHNVLKKFPDIYYNEIEINNMASPVIKADKRGVQSAGETLLMLLKKPKWLESVYKDLSMDDKLYLLEIIYQDVRDLVYSENAIKQSIDYPVDSIQFISERFKKRSDLILKTVDSYLDGMQPAEITLLLDIICVISSNDSVESHFLQNDKSLIINCIYLLKSLHMSGKECDNYFTPVQSLKELAPCSGGTDDSAGRINIESHPAFGFKAGLIRAIGNLSHKHKGNQELIRETDTIPLLLDCCNIDARNPLIMQWTIFALRNVCENSPENQSIIANCNKVGIVDNELLGEMGLKLHEDEDGKAIGILPLTRNK